MSLSGSVFVPQTKSSGKRIRHIKSSRWREGAHRSIDPPDLRNPRLPAVRPRRLPQRIGEPPGQDDLPGDARADVDGQRSLRSRPDAGAAEEGPKIQAAVIILVAARCGRLFCIFPEAPSAWPRFRAASPKDRCFRRGPRPGCTIGRAFRAGADCPREPSAAEVLLSIMSFQGPGGWRMSRSQNGDEGFPNRIRTFFAEKAVKCHSCRGRFFGQARARQ